MTLIRLKDISLAFGEDPLLDHVELQIEKGERCFLIGRNGSGKSCLLKLIAGHLKADGGEILYPPKIKIAELQQELPFSSEATVFEMVSEGLKEVGTLLETYHTLFLEPPENHNEEWLNKLDFLQKEIERLNGWQYQQRIDATLTALELNPDVLLKSLSGGWQRRVALARAIVSEPDLLLLDEPTNHLDIAAIEWLEDYLSRYQGAVLCITHDRSLLSRISTRILELDRGILQSFEGNFTAFLADKQHQLMVEARHNALFDKKLAQEETWIREGIKARRTRNEGRVRALEALRRERTQRRELQGKPNFKLNDTPLSGKLVIEAEDINFSFNDKVIIKDFSTRIFRGDRIALIGHNGTGKSTLLKLLLGQLQPQTGSVKIGTNLQIAYFDQLRTGIDPKLSAIENVAGGREMIEVNGRQQHILSYLGDFLFTPLRARTPVSKLSGGECNRLLLAKLFSLPNNLLVLDEPTNDLDIETLELLEEILMDYPGTILLVSHDRTFVDNVASSSFKFFGEGKIVEYVGGYSDIPQEIPASPTLKGKAAAPSVKNAPISKNTLSHKEKTELEQLPKTIADLEQQQVSLQAELNDPQFYKKAQTVKTALLAKISAVDTLLQAAYARWETLENP